MEVKRLRRLIKVLEGVERARLPFDLDVWGRATDAEGNDPWEDGTPISEACGTVCCAVGYGALDRRLRAEGLKMIVNADGVMHEVSTVGAFNRILRSTQKNTPAGESAYFYALIKYGPHTDWDAVGAFFGLNHGLAQSLFLADSYPKHKATPRDVIRRIEALIAEHEGKIAPAEQTAQAQAPA